MSKFIIGQILKTNQLYKDEVKRLDIKHSKLNFQGRCIKVYEQENYDPIYYFDKYDNEGNQLGIREFFFRKSLKY